jgi:hypothetical protein
VGDETTDQAPNRDEAAPAPRRFVPRNDFVAAFRDAPPIDPERFRDDVDHILNQDPTPRD